MKEGEKLEFDFGRVENLVGKGEKFWSLYCKVLYFHPIEIFLQLLFAARKNFPDG